MQNLKNKINGLFKGKLLLSVLIMVFVLTATGNGAGNSVVGANYFSI